jgi:hypothetical protein
MNLEPLKMKVTHAFEMLGTSYYPEMQSYIPEDPNLQLGSSKSPKSHTDVLV